MELIQIGYQEFTKYIFDFWNIIDLSSFGIFIIFFIRKAKDEINFVLSQQEAIVKKENVQDYFFSMSALHERNRDDIYFSVLIFIMFFRFQFYMRIFE